MRGRGPAPNRSVTHAAMAASCQRGLWRQCAQNMAAPGRGAKQKQQPSRLQVRHRTDALQELILLRPRELELRGHESGTPAGDAEGNQTLLLGRQGAVSHPHRIFDRPELANAWRLLPGCVPQSGLAAVERMLVQVREQQVKHSTCPLWRCDDINVSSGRISQLLLLFWLRPSSGQEGARWDCLSWAHLVYAGPAPQLWHGFFMLGPIPSYAIRGAAATTQTRNHSPKTTKKTGKEPSKSKTGERAASQQNLSLEPE